MNRPAKLFHASPSIDIEEFEPRNEYPRYTEQTKLIFATPHEGLAAIFLSPRNIRTEIGIYGNRFVVFINSSKKEYAKQDKGGAIYLLPVDTFETDTVHDMGDIEWYSETSVKPLGKTIYKTSIEAMDEFKVDRFFVSDSVFKKIQANPAEALKLME